MQISIEYKPLCHKLVAYADKAQVGYCEVRIYHLPLPTHVYIMGLEVHPEFRRKGIGMKLVLESIKLADSSGARYVELVVSSDNESALNLYKKAGFCVHESFGNGRAFTMRRSIK